MQKKISLLILIFLLIFSASSYIAWISFKKNYQSEIQIGGDFVLKNISGNDFSLKGSLNKKYALIFFGYSKCPTICPKALTNIFNGLEENNDLKKKFKAIFITLDPKNDSIKILKEFSKNFEDQIEMLTSDSGDNEQVIKKIAQDYKIYYSKNKETNEIDHTSIVYIVDRKGNYLGHTSADNQKEFENELIKFLSKNN
jgi:protein SCO1/2